MCQDFGRKGTVGLPGWLQCFLSVSWGQVLHLGPQSWAYQWCWQHLRNNIFKGEKCCPEIVGEKSEKNMRSSPSDTKSVKKKEEVLQVPEQCFPCSLWRSWSGLNDAEARIKTSFWNQLQPVGRSPQSSLAQRASVLEQGISDKQYFMERTHSSTALEERSTPEQFVKDCILWEAFHGEVGRKSVWKKEYKRLL